MSARLYPSVCTDRRGNENAPKDMKFVPMTGMPGYYFAMTITVLDCTGCGSCANVCPGKKGEKALELKSLESQLSQQESFAYGFSLPVKPEVNEKFKETTVKGSQFKQPLLEFSGACAGCGETPMQNSPHSYTATECISPTQPDAPLSGAALLLQHLTPLIKTVSVLLGQTPCLRTTLNTVTVFILHRQH